MRIQFNSKAFLSWLGVFAVAMLVMVQPVYASGTLSGNYFFPAGSLQDNGGGCLMASSGMTAADPFPQCVSALYSNQSGSIIINTQNSFISTFDGTSWTPHYFHQTTVSQGSCPANSTGTTSCTCTNPYIPDGNATSCVVPLWQGSNSVSVCNSSGVCSPSTYSTADSACQTFIQGGAPSSATLISGNVCKVDQYYSDGSHKVSYFPLTNVNSCAAGDTACLSGVAFSAAAINTLAYASNVSAASTLAVSAAYQAATLAGASSSVAQAASQQAAAQAAADATRSSQSPTDYTRESTQQAIKADLDAIRAQGAASAVGGVQAVSGSLLPSLGSGSWYVKTYPSGVTGVMTTNFNVMKATPLYGLLGHITPTLAGTAHNGCFTLSVWKVGNQQVCIPSGVLTFIGICIVLTALFSSRAIIFGG